jgi:predicted DNA-binding protein with PD1-like motif
MIKSGFKNQMVHKNNTYLDIVLEDGEGFIDCIEEAFKTHEVKKAVLVSATGFLKEVKVAMTKSGTMRQAEYSQPCMIRSVSGEFYQKAIDYFGDVHISLAKDPIHQITGVLLDGYAHGEVTIKFKIIKDMGHPEEKKDDQQMTMLKQKILDESRPKEKKPIIEA